jgi:hypothetical protein
MNPPFSGKFELVHEAVVYVLSPPRVEQRGVDADPDRGLMAQNLRRRGGSQSVVA